jgi:solute carrier family 9B (sodium/hydrogen exchanger), member 1/2
MYPSDQRRPSGILQRKRFDSGLTILPQVGEATVIALLSHGLFGMPISVGYVLGYNIACISPSIIVPGLMSLNDRGYGKDKNIAGTLIASGTFDDILCIICFGICKAVALSIGGFSTGNSIAWEIGLLFIEKIIALFVGVSLALFGWFFKFIKNDTLRINLKLAFCVFGAICFVIFEEHASSHDAKYVSALAFGYTCFRLWEQDKPAKEIAWFWFFM